MTGHINESSITTREIEGGLDQFLYSYVGSGEAFSRGAILIKSVPSSKLRKSAPHAFSARTPIPVIVWQKKIMIGDEGVVRLDYKQRDETIHWLPGVEATAADRPQLSEEQMRDLVCGGGLLGEQCAELRSTPQGLRQALHISAFPVCAPDGRFRDMCQEAGVTHLYGSYINISAPGAIIPVRTSIAATTTIYFHHRGSARVWIVIPPKDKEAFEEKMRGLCVVGPSACSQFVRHAGLWVTTEALKSWKISFTEIVQEEHQLVFIFPGSYFWGYSAGFSIIESKMHGGERWDIRGYRYCDLETGPCQVNNLGLRFEDSSFLVSRSGSEIGMGSSTKHGSKKRKLGHREKAVLALRTGPGVCEPTANTVIRAVSSAVAGGSGDGGTIIVDGERRRGVNVPTSAAFNKPVETTATTIDEIFNISDDEDDVSPVLLSASDKRVVQLQQENAAVLRDLATVRAERDTLKERKAMYKARLLDREAVIVDLENKVHDLSGRLNADVEDAKKATWREMKALVDSRLV